MHFLHDIDEECDGIANRRLLDLLIAAEAKEPFLNQVVDVVAARPAALKQATPQRIELPLESAAQGAECAPSFH
jgi:hypothetical protein